MHINNSHPRMSWGAAQAVLERHVHSVVAENNEFIKDAVEICRESRHEAGEASMALAQDWLHAAKLSRSQSRELLAALNTMSNGDDYEQP